MICNVVSKIYNNFFGKIPKTLEFKELSHFYPNIKKGRVIKVYDGDSITIAARVPNLKGGKIYKFNIRLNRIDTPEIKTKNNIEKYYGLKIRDYLSEKIMNKMIRIEIKNTDKYGRYLAEIFYKKENINTWLLKNHYAVDYDGGKKNTFCPITYNPQLNKSAFNKIVIAKVINPIKPIYDEGNEGFFNINLN
jgi:endonuclease YncB( thermonuclease family)